MRPMTYDELIAYYGTQKKAADALGVEQPSVSDWRSKGIPLPRQAQYELLTDGVLKADLPVPKKRVAAAKRSDRRSGLPERRDPPCGGRRESNHVDTQLDLIDPDKGSD